MHKGEFIGAKAEKQFKRILILGESHHWEKEDWELQAGETEEEAEERRRIKAEKYQTEDVVRRYLDNYSRGIGGTRIKAYRFFERIVRTFNYDPEMCRDVFWSKVFFGNYVEELCGIRDSKALKAIQNKNDLYNKRLFEFINDNRIDYVFCFSRHVYQYLPKLEKQQDIANEKDGTDRHRLEWCVYHSGSRNGVHLNKKVTVFGLCHPSQGYSYRKYQERIAKIIASEKLFEEI